jgi:hypothetical protein
MNIPKNRQTAKRWKQKGTIPAPNTTGVLAQPEIPVCTGGTGAAARN